MTPAAKLVARIRNTSSTAASNTRSISHTHDNCDACVPGRRRRIITRTSSPAKNGVTIAGSVAR